MKLRFNNRKNDQLREIKITPNINKYASGSCLYESGETKVICTATIEDRVPFFLRGSRSGWLTAEYSMLPSSTHQRNQRDIKRSSPNGRNIEIQRLISRSLRKAIDLSKIGEKTITIDCDVIQADGGTRCASINGGFVALFLAVKQMIDTGLVFVNPIIHNISAISCGINDKNNILLDLDYEEDSSCNSDVNFVISDCKNIVEVQGTGEKDVFSFSDLENMYNMSIKASKEINYIQNSIFTQNV